MIHYNCACLIHIEKGAIFLVRTYDHEHYYLPGGKIEGDESDFTALQRELKEELSLDVSAKDVSFWKSIMGPAYPNLDENVKLNCFLSQCDTFEYVMNHEITDARFIALEDRQYMAPAVHLVIDALKEEII